MKSESWVNDAEVQSSDTKRIQRTGKARNRGKYKERERQRTKKYYTPTADLDKIALNKTREKMRLQVQSFRKTKKQQRRMAKKAEDEYMAADSHGLRSSNNANKLNLLLIIDFNFHKKKKMVRKRVSCQVVSLQEG